MDKNTELNIINNLLSMETVIKEYDLNSLFKDKDTKFFNKHALERDLYKLALQMIKGQVSNEKNVFSILYCDINGLKLVNDNIGHSHGDNGIKQIASIIKKCLRINGSDVFLYSDEFKHNVAVRVGGDEFLAILPGCTKEHAEEAKKRIQDKIQESLQNTTGLSISIGIVDTNDLPIPYLLDTTNLQFDSTKNIEKVNTYFNNLVETAEQRMKENKISLKKDTTNELDKKLGIMSYVMRMCDIYGLNINNSDEFSRLLTIIEEARSEFLRERYK